MAVMAADEDIAPIVLPVAPTQKVLRHEVAVPSDVPRIRINGRLIPVRIVASHIEAVATQTRLPSASRQVREAAAAAAVLDDLLFRKATRHGRHVSHAALRKYTSALLRVFERYPGEAVTAGVPIPRGESARRFLFSRGEQQALAAYLEVQRLRRSLDGNTRNPAVRRSRYARWLRGALRHYHVEIRGLPRFSVPRALPLAF
jgi:hypothetical protein